MPIRESRDVSPAREAEAFADGRTAPGCYRKASRAARIAALWFPRPERERGPGASGRPAEGCRDR